MRETFPAARSRSPAQKSSRRPQPAPIRHCCTSEGASRDVRRASELSGTMLRPTGMRAALGAGRRPYLQAWRKLGSWKSARTVNMQSPLESWQDRIGAHLQHHGPVPDPKESCSRRCLVHSHGSLLSPPYDIIAITNQRHSIAPNARTRWRGGLEVRAMHGWWRLNTCIARASCHVRAARSRQIPWGRLLATL